MLHTLESEIKWKDGSTWPAGSDVTIQWGEDHRGPYVVSRGYGADADTRKCSGRTLGKALAGYFPELAELEEYVYDSVCESPTGHTVEPDGWGPDGVPSWLILAGLI